MEAAGIGEPLSAGTTAGRFNDRFTWQMSADRLAPAPAPASERADGKQQAALLAVYEIRVTVSWRDGLASRSVSLTSLRAAREGKPA